MGAGPILTQSQHDCRASRNSDSTVWVRLTERVLTTHNNAKLLYCLSPEAKSENNLTVRVTVTKKLFITISVEEKNHYRHNLRNRM